MNNCELHLGDGLAALEKLPPASLRAIISDPPFANTNLAWDTPVDWSVFWREATRVLQPGGVAVLFACGHFLRQLIETNKPWYRYRLVWVKPDSVTGFLDAKRRPLRAFEDVVVFARMQPAYFPQMEPGKAYTVRGGNKQKTAHYGGQKGIDGDHVNEGRYPTDVLQYTAKDGDHGLHPTQKPVALMRHLVCSYTRPGDLVGDPFMGSGSTGAACIETGRRFWGCERDEKIHATALARLTAATPLLFAEKPKPARTSEKPPRLFDLEKIDPSLN